jgi:hypothetical protein
MLPFVFRCGLAFVAALLTATGGSHLVRLPDLARLLRHHRLLPPAAALPAALAVTAVELATAATAAGALVAGSWRLAAAASAAAVISGGGFVAYLRQLVRRSGRGGSCGCTPFDSPLTPASFAPAAGLVAAGALGLALSPAGSLDPTAGPAWSMLPVVWGLSLAGLVALLPATAPRSSEPGVLQPAGPGAEGAR